MAQANWYYSEAGQQQGPVDEQTLRQLIAAGRVTRTDVVWSEGMAEWTSAGNVPELLSAFAAAPVQPQAPAPVYGAPAYGAQPYGAPYGGAPYAAPPHVGYVLPGQPAVGYATPGAYGQYQYGHQPGVGYYSPTGFVEYAGFWLRFVAALLDGLILMIPAILIGAAAYFALDLGTAIEDVMNQYEQMFQSAGRGGPPQPVVMPPELVGFRWGMQLVMTLIGWLYFAIQESGKHQATFGKRALGLRVTDADGNRISFGRASGRFFGKILCDLSCYIGYIIAGFTQRKQGLHDLIAKCLVVKKQRQ